MSDSSRFTRIAAAVAAGVVVAICWPIAARTQTAGKGEVLVFAAASLQTALDALAGPAQRATGVTMRMSYAASSALARQIESGAPADLFISADLEWMDYLQARQFVRAESRIVLLSNRLVLIASRSRPVALPIGPRFPLADVLGRDRLALADPAVVPAGKYARAALTTLGVWDSIASKIAAAENVRAALRLVALGEAPLGIVYRTDALVEPGVVVVDTFAEATHPRIVYPLALTATASPQAASIVNFLTGAAARKVFAAQGFGIPARE